MEMRNRSITETAPESMGFGILGALAGAVLVPIFLLVIMGIMELIRFIF